MATDEEIQVVGDAIRDSCGGSVVSNAWPYYAKAAITALRAMDREKDEPRMVASYSAVTGYTEWS